MWAHSTHVSARSAGRQFSPVVPATPDTSRDEKEKPMSIENQFVLDVLSYPDWDDGEATLDACSLYSTP
jgi:hypothetical protein